MKKNILNIITLALVVVSLILNVVMVFSVMPTSNKTNDMITKVCTALDLELESEKTGDETDDYNISQLETYKIGEGEEMTINLAPSGEDSGAHFAVLQVSIVVNTEHEDYEKYAESITTKESLIKDAINSVVSSFTVEEMQNNPEGVQKAVLERLQKLFDSDFIVKVAFDKKLFQ